MWRGVCVCGAGGWEPRCARVRCEEGEVGSTHDDVGGDIRLGLQCLVLIDDASQPSHGQRLPAIAAVESALPPRPVWLV